MISQQYRNAVNSICTLLLFGTIYSSGVSCSHAQDEPISESEIFDSTRILDVQIELDESDWDVLRAQSRGFAESITKDAPESPFTYFRGDVTINGRKFSSVGIRKKGFIGSLDTVRPSLKIKFNEFEERGPIAGLDRLTLNNNKQDPSHLSAYLTFKLFRDAGVPAPRCNWAKVTVNGRYLGIYSNVESIKSPFLRQHFGSPDGNLYEGTVADFYVDRLQRFEIKTNRKTNDASDIRRLAEVLDSPDEGLVEELKEIIEYERFLSYWAVESMVGWWDGYTSNQNNYFVYHDPTTSKFTFMPWGTDSSFTKAPSILDKPGPESVQTAGLVAHTLYQYEEVQNDYRRTVLELLDSIWQEDELVAEIERAERLLADHISEDQPGFDKALDGVRDFITKRRSVLEKEMADGPAAAVYEARRPMYFVVVGSLNGSFETAWKDTRDADPFGGTLEVDLKIDGESVEFSRFGVKAEPAIQLFPSPNQEREPPTVVFTGQRSSDNVRMTLAVSFKREQFHSGNEGEVKVEGILLEGFNFREMRFISGTAKLESAAEEEGAPVVGSLDIQIAMMKGIEF